MDDQFFKKNKAFTNSLSHAGSKLKDANKKSRFGRNEENPLKIANQNRTNRHIEKY